MTAATAGHRAADSIAHNRPAWFGQSMNSECRSSCRWQLSRRIKARGYGQQCLPIQTTQRFDESSRLQRAK
jgi:hypothetical protein